MGAEMQVFLHFLLMRTVDSRGVAILGRSGEAFHLLYNFIVARGGNHKRFLMFL